MSKYDFQEGQINQLKTEKVKLEEMVSRRTREINDQIETLQRWIDTDGNKIIKLKEEL